MSLCFRMYRQPALSPLSETYQLNGVVYDFRCQRKFDEANRLEHLITELLSGSHLWQNKQQSLVMLI